MAESGSRVYIHFFVETKIYNIFKRKFSSCKYYGVGVFLLNMPRASWHMGTILNPNKC